MEKLYSTNFLIKTSKEDNREIEFIASKELMDRDNDIIKVKGINLKNYKKNPVVLFAHNRHELPIGKAVKITKSGDVLKIKVQFATAEENPKADQVYRLLKGNYLNAVSIGFIPNYDKIDYDDKKNMRVFNEIELFELSVVPVPANADALATGKSLAKAFEDEVLNEDEYKEWSDSLDDILPNEEQFKALEEKLKTIEVEVAKLNEEKEEKELPESYMDKLFKEFSSDGGTVQSDPDIDPKSLNDLFK